MVLLKIKMYMSVRQNTPTVNILHTEHEDTKFTSFIHPTWTEVLGIINRDTVTMVLGIIDMYTVAEVLGVINRDTVTEVPGQLNRDIVTAEVLGHPQQGHSDKGVGHPQ